MSKQKIRTLRLRKEEISLEKQPLENAFVKRVDDLKFYFCLYNLQDDFKDGFYFGLLQLHNQYPFAAPKLFVYTPNGRYESNIAICTSFTNYHQESWTSAWNVRTLIQATISFMYADEPSYGCRQDSSVIRKKFARQSLEWNMKNQLFVNLFGQAIKEKLSEIDKKSKNENNEKLKEGHQNQKKQQIDHNNYRIDIRDLVVNNNDLNVNLIDKPQKNNNQENDEQRKRYRKKVLIICGIVVLLAGGSAIKIYLSLNK